MYESMTYDKILQRMISSIRVKNANLDTREGSIIYDAIAPAAMEMMMIYIELENILTETFGDTASREYLIRRAAERGISPEPATKSILKGEFNIDVPIGSRYSLDDLNYVVLERLGFGIYLMECESLGIGGNLKLGNLIPIEYIEGLKTATLTEVLIPGEDVEDTERFRKRYFESLDAKAFGGNIKDYQEKTKAINGIGGVKVYPVWNGGGTVKLVIIDSDFKKPTSLLLAKVQTEIDPTQNSGMGLGTAPIGHTVTVESVRSVPIDIDTNITYKQGWQWDDVKPYVAQMIEDYFYELAQNWETNENLVVRISQIETRLLSLDGIVDIADTILNKLSQNLILGTNDIPIRGDVNG